MDNSILNDLPNLSLTATISVLTLFLKNMINSFNMRPVEKICFTNSKRMMIHFSQIVILSIAFTIIFDATLIFENAFNWKNSNTLRIYLICSFIFMLIITFIVYIIVYLYVQLISLKVKFFLIDDNEQKWTIVRRVNKETILLEGESNNFKFWNFNDLNEVELFEELITDNISFKIHKNRIWLFVVFFVEFTILMVLLFFFSYIPAVFLGYFILFTIYLCWKNKKTIKKLRDGQQ
ncbi:hypothetical protein [Heyndrickxia oleronia]|uniref:hypothetical protein n=1 Tax=Heyndrickxia oleronia TaxID=38875 RepID=UPI00243232C0|nr:hypothetical protein [Heyndrickxia oleronia]MCI1615973.1 DUF1097 domain-containing protein [Heyndrickxia oleronia]